MNEHEVIEKLKAEGYQRIYISNVDAGELDKEHTHAFDVKIVVLAGGITIMTKSGEAEVNKLYRIGEEILIPKNVPHAVLAYDEGCRYIVAEGEAGE